MNLIWQLTIEIAGEDTDVEVEAQMDRDSTGILHVRDAESGDELIGLLSPLEIARLEERAIEHQRSIDDERGSG